MLDFVSLCQEEGLPLIQEGHHHCHEGWAQTHCPFCSGGRDGWHLGFNLEGGNFNCWRCGSLGYYAVLRGLFPNRPLSEIKGLLAKYHRDFPTHKRQERPRKQQALKPPGIGPLKPVHEDYLKKRNFDPIKLVQDWNAYGTCQDPNIGWAWRIVVPIKNTDNEVTAYTGRALQKKRRPKWKTTEKDQCKQSPNSLLYGIEHVKDSVVVVEGPADVWRLGKGAVALLGIDWTVEQAAIIRTIPHRFILFDPDTAAKKKAEELALWLAAFPGETELITEMNSDPGDMSQREADQLMQELGMR